MSAEIDFERSWLSKFSDCLAEIAGESVQEVVMTGSDALSDQADPAEIINWTNQALEILSHKVKETDRQSILTGCACHYPTEALQPLKEAYAATGDINIPYRMLQDQFENLLRNILQLPESDVQTIISQNWGAAGVLDSNKIIATKIRKVEISGNTSRPAIPKRRGNYIVIAHGFAQVWSPVKQFHRTTATAVLAFTKGSGKRFCKSRWRWNY